MDDNEQRYRRGMDREYVTRHEFQMHLTESSRVWGAINNHLEKQDNEIDRLQTTISRAIGGATAVIIVAQTLVTYFISR